jgi:AcrR family transcriptional regulator
MSGDSASNQSNLTIRDDASAWVGRAEHAPAGSGDRRGAALEVRKRPTQARGAATFNAIIDTALQLLDELGAEALTTNLVAERAGVNIATLYQYFPSKEAILLEAFRRDTDARMAAGQNLVDRVRAVHDWRTIVSETVDELARMRVTYPGVAALRRAMQSMPELRAHERETMLSAADFVAAMLGLTGRVDPEAARRIGLCTVEVLTALLDVWSFGHARVIGEQDDWVIDELKRVLSAYLAPYFDPVPGASDGAP